MLLFSYPVTNSVDTDLILEVSCDNKFWPMDPKSKRNQCKLKRNRERASEASCSSSYKAIRPPLYRVPICTEFPFADSKPLRTLEVSITIPVCCLLAFTE